jgi:hypothetical protein
LGIVENANKLLSDEEYSDSDDVEIELFDKEPIFLQG